MAFSARFFVGRSYGHSWAHFLHPLGDDPFAGFYSIFDYEKILIPVSKGYRSQSDFVVTANDVNHLRALLLHHSLLRDEKRILSRIAGGADASELSWPNQPLRIGKLGNNCQSACFLINRPFRNCDLSFVRKYRSVRQHQVNGNRGLG